MNAESIGNMLLDFLPVGVIFPVILIIIIVILLFVQKNENKRNIRNSINKYIMLGICLLLLVPSLRDTYQYVLLLADSNSSQYNEKSGVIEDAMNSSSLTGKYIMIENNRYYCDPDIARYAEDNIGRSCDILFTKNARYIVYFIIDRD
jgi:hypothetical protein